MSSSSRENDFIMKQEDIDEARIPKGASSSRPWLGLKDPRIVRVSRSFGGKDRHSKVRTIRGLRDRRVRLSVQTAIQLYDLQDRLGLNQPSKVVDWLLEAAQHEIDKLPPLQIPPEFFLPPPAVASHELTTTAQHPTSSIFSTANMEHISSSGIRPFSSTTKGITKGGCALFVEDQTTPSRSKHWNSSAPSTNEFKQVRREATIEKIDWNEGTEQENKEAIQVPRAPFSESLSLPPYSYSSIPNTSICHWDVHPNAHGYPSQRGESHNFNTTLIPPSLSLPFGSHLIFPSHFSASTNCDPRQMNHIQMLSSSSQHLLPSAMGASLYSIPYHENQSSSFSNQP